MNEWAGEDWIADLCQSNSDFDSDKIIAKDDCKPADKDKDFANVSQISELVMLPDGNCLPVFELQAAVVPLDDSDMPVAEWEEIAMQSEDIMRDISTLADGGHRKMSSNSTPSTPPSSAVLASSPLTPPPSTQPSQAAQHTTYVNP
ncbi:hypothetical protein OG21DRAFT_1526147 [Imleria badia]|nr:hypothetical protein OG21DRAFT_1526147 [Imleria badia]